MKDLIVLHGALGSQKQFTALAESLKEHYRVHTMDFSGHGKNVGEDPFSIALFAADLKKYIAEQQIIDPYIFGYSMGGYVALFLEAETPGSIKKIITLGTKFEWNPESSKKESGYLNPEKIQEKIPAYAEYLRTLHSEYWSIVLDKTADMMIQMGDDPPLNSSRLNQIEIPVVIGWGALDKMVSQEESETASRVLGSGQFEILENVLHPIDRIEIKVLKDYILKHV